MEDDGGLVFGRWMTDRYKEDGYPEMKKSYSDHHTQQ